MPLAQMFAFDSQLLQPLLDFLETASYVIEDLLDVMEVATIEALQIMSDAEVAGPPLQGKRPIETWLTTAHAVRIKLEIAKFRSTSYACDIASSPKDSLERSNSWILRVIRLKNTSSRYPLSRQSERAQKLFIDLAHVFD